jgi:hypothetical protein
VGVFLSFTLSQAGMVVHHLKLKEPRWKLHLLINLIGCLSTFVVLGVIGVTKFVHGAWMVIVLIPFLVLMFRKIHQHYLRLAFQLRVEPEQYSIKENVSHIVVMPISGIHRGILQAVSYASSMSKELQVVYVEIDPEQTIKLKREWAKFASHVPLLILNSPYRSLTEPLLDHIDSLSKNPNWDWVTVVIPEFITAKWWEGLLHNQSALFIKTSLMFKRKVVVTSIRYHLDS